MNILERQENNTGVQGNEWPFGETVPGNDHHDHQLPALLFECIKIGEFLCILDKDRKNMLLLPRSRKD